MRDATAAGDVEPSVDAEQAAFEINAALIAANTALLLHGDDRVVRRARTSIASTLRDDREGGSPKP